MHTATPHLSLWYALVTLTGVVAAVVIYVLTRDVVWTIVALVATGAVVRQLVRRNGATH